MPLEKLHSVFYNPYKDGKTLVVGVPFITVCATLIGTDNDLMNPLELQQISLKLVYNSLAVTLCWIIVRQIIVFLDARIPWVKGREVRRLLLQAPLILLGFNLVYLTITLFRTKLFSFWPIDWKEIWLTDYPISILFLLAINVAYYYRWQQLNRPVIPSVPLRESTLPPAEIMVLKGRAKVMLPSSEIRFAYRAHEVNYIVDDKGGSYLWDDSLSALEPLLPGYFRLNRQFLIKPVEVNKNRAAAFRRWLEGG